MEYTIDTLDTCIFDYLVLHKNEVKTLDEIFENVNCKDLPNELDFEKPGINSYKFMVTCYTLDGNYKNIIKMYRNDTVYLTFVTDLYNHDTTNGFSKSQFECNDDMEFLNIILHYEYDDFEIEFNGSLLKYVLNNPNLFDHIVKNYKISSKEYGNILLSEYLTTDTHKMLLRYKKDDIKKLVMGDTLISTEKQLSDAKKGLELMTKQRNDFMLKNYNCRTKLGYSIGFNFFVICVCLLLNYVFS